MRKDGVKLKNSEPMYTVAAYFMRYRYDAMNMVNIDIPIKPLHEYLNKKRKENQRISHLSLFLAAYIRVVSEFPSLNRFVVNKKFYARDELPIAMVVLKQDKNVPPSMSKVYFKKTDTVFDVNRKMDEYIQDSRSHTDDKTTVTVNKLLSIPGLLGVGVGLIRFADKHGFLPRALLDASPFHANMVITNLASIKTNYIYHHIYDFGTNAMIISIGNPREVPKRNRNGEIEFERCLPLGVVMDERIADGVYYARAFEKFKKYLANPELLEVEPETVTPDPDIKNPKRAAKHIRKSEKYADKREAKMLAKKAEKKAAAQA